MGVSQPAKDGATYRFNGFVLHVDRGTLTRDGEAIPLRPKAFAVLQSLLEHCGKLVTRDHLMATVWNREYVSDVSLNQCLIDIRRALGDKDHRIIRTLPKKGYLLDSPFECAVPQTGRVTDPFRPPGRRWAWLAGTAVMLMFVASGYALLGQIAISKKSPIQQTPSSQATIAVLPLNDLSEDSNQVYLADGLTEEILNTLAQYSDLRVIVGTSSFAFKDSGLEIEDIAGRLNLDYVLQGSIRKSGDRIRVTAHLLDPHTLVQHWSEVYDYQLGELFGLQKTIARAVVASLHAELNLGDAAYRAEPDPEAYEAYLLARFYNRRRNPGDVERAHEQLLKAVSLAPEFALAWSALAPSYLRLMEMEVGPNPSLLSSYRAAAERAFELDPALPSAQAVAISLYSRLGEVEKRDELLRKGLANHPNNPQLLLAARNEALDGLRLDDAEKIQRKVVQLDPISGVERGNLGALLLASGECESALNEIDQALELSPNLEGLSYQKAEALILLGRYDEAFRFLRSKHESLRGQLYMAMTLWGRGDLEKAHQFARPVTTGPGLEHKLLLAEWYAYRGQDENALQTLRVILEQMQSDCPDDEACQDAALLPYSPFLWQLRQVPNFRGWASEVLETYSRQLRYYLG